MILPCSSPLVMRRSEKFAGVLANLMKCEDVNSGWKLFRSIKATVRRSCSMNAATSTRAGPELSP